MELASNLVSEPPFFILAWIFALMYLTELVSFSILGFFFCFFKDSWLFYLGLVVLSLFYSGLSFVHFWLQYLKQISLLELFLQLSCPQNHHHHHHHHHHIPHYLHQQHVLFFTVETCCHFQEQNTFQIYSGVSHPFPLHLPPQLLSAVH